MKDQPDEIVVVFDYSLASVATTLDFVEFIISYLKRMRGLDAGDTIIQIIKVLGSEMTGTPQDIRSDIKTRLIIEGLSCTIIGSSENEHRLTAGEAIELLRLHTVKSRWPDTPVITIFCNTSDRVIVWTLGKLLLDRKTNVLAFPLFREPWWRRISRLFFEWTNKIKPLLKIN